MLATLAALALAAPAQADPGDLIRQDVQAKTRDTLTLYRGASSEAAFTPGKLRQIDTREDLVRAVASRLTSTSDKVTGLTSSPQTAGAFALGVKDGNPDTVRTHGLSAGFIGVTEARNLSASDFASLLQKHGATKRGLDALLGTLAASNVVVDASGVINALAPKYPGILTSGFQEMISASLSREAEYLVFGKNPAFKRVHPIQKSDVVEPNASISGPSFKPDLVRKLSKPASTTQKPGLTHKPVKTRTTTIKPVNARPRAVPRPVTRAPTPKPRRAGFFRRLFKLNKTSR